MPGLLTCDDVEQDALVARYLAGRLTPADVEAFEGHYLTCARCQAALRFAAGLRAALPESHPSRRHGRPWLTAGLLAAAAITGVLLVRPAARPGRFAAAGRVLEPPVYLGVQVRAARGSADSLFEAAMAHYSERRYREAVTGLEAALAAGADSLAGEFFLASGLLMLGRNGEAVTGYRRVMAAGETPYLQEARYYLARALLRLGRGEEALAELRSIEPRDDSVGTSARTLADSVEALIAR